MALASQVPRPDLLRSPSSRRTRKRKSRVRFVVGLLVVAVIAVVATRSLGWWGKDSEPAERQPVAAAETTRPAEVQREPQPEPLFTLTNPDPRSSRSQPTGETTRRSAAEASRPTTLTTAQPTAVEPQPRREPAPQREQATAATNEQSSAGVRGSLARAAELVEQGKLVDARLLLNRALHSSQTSPADRQRIRASMTDINQRLVFEPVLMQTDPFMRAYVIQSGDNFWKLARTPGVYVDENFLMRINGISSGGSLRVGQTIKIPTKPFHAVVRKASYRMDIYMGDADRRDEWMFVRSFPVGLGEYDSTPAGRWVVTEGRKTVNPDWRNPRTGEYFSRDDPNNPIGDYWIALTGTDDNTRARSGYGIHGTIEPESIGQSASMGCVRMLPDDIELVYGMLAEVHSVVWIVED